MNPAKGTSCSKERGWPLERALFVLAGGMILLSVALVALISPWFLILTAFVGVNQWLYASIGACPASLAIGRVFGLPSSYNGASDPGAESASSPRAFSMPGGRSFSSR